MRRLIKNLQIKNPQLFGAKPSSTRSIIDHSKILARTEQFSTNMGIDLSIVIIQNASQSLINEKYRFEKEIKESTFSHTWIVKLKVQRNKNRAQILSQKNQR